jgi:hypothetical protein
MELPTLAQAMCEEKAAVAFYGWGVVRLLQALRAGEALPGEEPLRFATPKDAELVAADKLLTGNAFVRVDDDGLAHRIDPELVWRG